MHDDFEKEISHRMQQFRISPQPVVWQQVEAALPPERHRRRFFWWWLLPVPALLLAGICLVSRHHQPIAANRISQLQPGDTARQTAGIRGPEGSEKAMPATRETVQKAGPQTGFRRTQQKEDPPANASVISGKTVLLPAATSPAGTLSAGTGKPPADTMPVARQSVPAPVLPPDQPYLQTSILHPHPVVPGPNLKSPNKAEDSLLPALLAQEKSSSVTGTGVPDSLADSTTGPLASIQPVMPRQEVAGMPSSPNTTDVLPGKKTGPPVPDTAGKRTRQPAAASRRGSWLVAAALGSSWMQGKGNSSKARYQENTYAFSSPGTVVPGGNPAARLYYPENGLNLAAGIGRIQPFARYWDGQLLLHYQLLTARQVTGLPAVTAGSGGLTNGVGGSGSNNPVYRAGTSSTHRIAVHQLQLAPGIGYTFFAHARFPIRLTTGLFLGWNRYSRLLLHDYRNNSYVQSDQYNQQWTWGAAAGGSVLIRHKVQVGLLYQYHFTNVGKPAVRSDFRWRQLQLQVAIPVF